MTTRRSLELVVTISKETARTGRGKFIAHRNPRAKRQTGVGPQWAVGDEFLIDESGFFVVESVTQAHDGTYTATLRGI
jgi:hypothetical protein